MVGVKRISLSLRGELVEIETRIMESESEREEVRDIIRKEYQLKGYISKDLTKFEDEYEEGSTYFGTFCNDMLLAAARITDAENLPTRTLFFEFPPPAPLEKCPKGTLREVGRLTALRRPGDNPLPRHVLSAATVSALIDYGYHEDICGGVSTIKASFLRLFKRLELPALHRIEGAKLICPRGALLSGFFYDDKDPPVAVFYRTDEAKAIFDGLFHSILRTGRTLLDEPLRALSYEVLI